MSSTRPKLLLVDDNEVFRGALEKTLAGAGYEVTTAGNGNAAKELIGIASFNFVVSDINMAPGSGIDLLRYIKDTMNVPVILMTGFTNLLETHEAIAMGAAGFLAKPFKLDELVRLLDSLSGAPQDRVLARAHSEQTLDAHYCKLSIEDFISGHEIKYDLYVRISENKYVKIANHGEDIPVERIRSYKSKGLMFLYMKKDDFRKYLTLSIAISHELTKNDQLDKEKKIQLIQHSNEVLLEYIYNNNLDVQVIESAKTLVVNTLSVLSDMTDFFTLIDNLSRHSSALYAHSLGVSVYSVMIAREMHWHSPATLLKVAFGALLHDIGKREIDEAILAKQRIEMSPAEIALIESHPVRGMELLSSVSSISSDILQIVLQHHESCSGTGYPSKLKKNKIHPLARLIATANEFCWLTLKPPAGLGFPPDTAVIRLHDLFRDRLDPAFLSALARLLDVKLSDPPGEAAP